MNTYNTQQPTLAEISALEGPCLLNFGTSWCGYCIAAQPLINLALAQYRDVKHLKVEDGKGRRLGRSFSVKLWPTLIFMKDGIELKRIVRPTTIDEIIMGLTAITI